MVQVYSQRIRSTPTDLRYDLPHLVRGRLWHTLCIVTQATRAALGRFQLGLMHNLQAQYGRLDASMADASAARVHIALAHFCACSTERALDFVEIWFQSEGYNSGQRGVDAVNEVFREESIGYELSPWMNYRAGNRAYPTVIRRENALLHTEVIAPCIQLLARPAFAVANREWLDAFAKYRRGDYDGALTLCCSAFESVLKTICVEKGWAFDPTRDTCSGLVTICSQNGLFPSYYNSMLVGVASVRNRLGDAHGRGPITVHDADRDHVEHLLHTTAAHIVFLVKQAGT